MQDPALKNEIHPCRTSLRRGEIVLTHTEVPEKYEGQGIGSELTRAVLEDLRAKKLPMIPQCPFVAQYIYRHPEWADVVLKEVPAK